jgi:hypothetical protein
MVLIFKQQYAPSFTDTFFQLYHFRNSLKTMIIRVYTALEQILKAGKIKR